MKRIFFTLAIFFVLTLSVQANQFSRNLSLGDRGVDVLELQRVLNKNPETKVSLSGPGSPGNETEYFGSLTRNAVIKFQNLYREEILTPVGLTFGTGFVGPSTRKKLNDAQEIEIPVLENEILNNSDGFYIMGPESYVVGREQTVSINGSGFTSKTKLTFDGRSVEITNVSSNTISFRVPKGTTFGKKDITVREGSDQLETFVIVKDSALQSPSISSVSPEKASSGEEVTISGSGFTANSIISLGYEEVQGTLSDQKLSFVMPAFQDGGQEGDAQIEIPINIRVYNEGGMSNAYNAKLIYKYESN